MLLQPDVKSIPVVLHNCFSDYLWAYCKLPNL